MRLTAVFNVPLPFNLLINNPTYDPLQFTVTLEEFSVDLGLIHESGFRMQAAGDDNYTYGVTRLILAVAREEPDPPPPPGKTAQGGNDYATQVDYFEARHPQYQRVAVELVNRIITYFMYTLNNPVLYTLDPRDQVFRNATWLDEAGKEVGKGTTTFVVPFIPGLNSSSYGVQKLTPERHSDLVSALQAPIVPTLTQELLLDARSAIFAGSLRRAALEMAIACEVAVKPALVRASQLSQNSAAEAKVERILRGPFVQLLHRPARLLLGSSFKEAHPESYAALDVLFRCRNRIAHAGITEYRDSHGQTHQATESKVAEWWKAVEDLIDWCPSPS
jgi:hypothetical protein